jgi:hypothetical protein
MRFGLISVRIAKAVDLNYLEINLLKRQNKTFPTQLKREKC